ncbi:molybdopterin-guanine dinucleotide biosynthesis protein B [Bacillus shivajii]|uniref:molybdopterin-guanine dinucleotide biosynthesis protein B n=1 Tax=Bacillus shivajii TaxID=1983719 RepID=UPI001CFBC495|nr:molybdopterin-guanine dinucleotide biosynthesis protein B [Bacillus shivajii]UCZ51995.1 molybdopterin-guanine dinucleotide biosynthesis protein B [Bacillus shivajii]
MTKSIPIFQIVGFSNSGKTTLMKNLIMKVREYSLTVATIKHHGHDSKLKALDEATDSGKHRESGATASLVASEDELQLHIQGQTYSLDDLIAFYDKVSLDILLVEGFKREKYEKIVLLRDKNDEHLLDNCVNVKAIICWEEVHKSSVKKRSSLPVFHISEKGRYLTYILKLLLG